MRNPRRAAGGAQAGFTLIEALIAMVIISFGLIAVTNLMLVASTSNTVANQSSAATSIASERMERLKALRFDDPALDEGGDLTADAAGYFEVEDRARFINGVGTIRTRWQVTVVDETTKFIVVRSEGTGALAGPRSRAEFTTFRVQNPKTSTP